MRRQAAVTTENFLLIRVVPLMMTLLIHDALGSALVAWAPNSFSVAGVRTAAVSGEEGGRNVWRSRYVSAWTR